MRALLLLSTKLHHSSQRFASWATQLRPDTVHLHAWASALCALGDPIYAFGVLVPVFALSILCRRCGPWSFYWPRLFSLFLQFHVFLSHDSASRYAHLFISREITLTNLWKLCMQFLASPTFWAFHLQPSCRPRSFCVPLLGAFSPPTPSCAFAFLAFSATLQPDVSSLVLECLSSLLWSIVL